MRLLLDPTAAGFDYRASGQSRLGPFTSNGRILLPPRRTRRSSRSPRSTSAGRARAATCAPIPAGSPARWTVAGGGLDGTLGFAPVGDAQKIEAHLRASNVRFPALAVRAGRRRRQRHPRRGPDDARRRRSMRAGLQMSGISLARLTANAKLVNGTGQVRALLAGRRGAAFDFTTLADVSPDSIRLTGKGSVERRPLVLNQAAVLTRSGDGWALAPTSISFCRRASGRCPGAADRGRKCTRSCSPCRSKCSTSAGRTSTSAARERSARLCLEGQSQRPRRPQDPRPQPRRAWCSPRSRSTSASPPWSTGNQAAMRAVAVSGGTDDRPGAGALRADRRRPTAGRADERAAVRAASLRRAGGHLVAAVRDRDVRPHRARSRSAPTSAAGWSTRRSAARSGRRSARLESAVTGMVIDQLAGGRRASPARN